MSTPQPDPALAEGLARIDALLSQIDRVADPQTREHVTDIIQGLLELHGQALAHILETLEKQGDASRPMLDALEADQVVSSVLLVHGLHPRPIEQRVQRALEQVHPYLAAHKGSVELLGVGTDAVVHLRLDGNCHGCPSSRVTLSNLIEQAIYAAAPDVAGIEVEGAAEPAAAGPAHGPQLTQLSINGAPVCGVGPPPNS
jgi:Fe-S cluster biogenesis protein NfuA